MKKTIDEILKLKENNPKEGRAVAIRSTIRIVGCFIGIFGFIPMAFLLFLAAEILAIEKKLT